MSFDFVFYEGAGAAGKAFLSEVLGLLGEFVLVCSGGVRINL